MVAGEARFAPVLRTLAAMHTYAIDPGKLREMQDPDSGLSLRSDGSNVASVLKEIRRQAPEDITRIGELLASIVPTCTFPELSASCDPAHEALNEPADFS